MKKVKRILAVLACAVLIAEGLLALFAVVRYRETKPLLHLFETDAIERITFGAHQKETELKESEIIRMRMSLFRLNLYGPCLRRHFNFRGNAEGLHIYARGGETHLIVFEGSIRVLGMDIGIVAFDGKEYICDPWLVRHFNYICRDFRNR